MHFIYILIITGNSYQDKNMNIQINGFINVFSVEMTWIIYNLLFIIYTKIYYKCVNQYKEKN